MPVHLIVQLPERSTIFARRLVLGVIDKADRTGAAKRCLPIDANAYTLTFWSVFWVAYVESLVVFSVHICSL
jgi:hypothetical protein